MNTDVERAELILWHRREYERLLREADREHEGKGGNEYDDEQERGRAV